MMGVANAVFHPADYAILGTVIEPSRLGKAFSYHTFAGFLGSAMAPMAMLAMAGAIGPGPAIAVSGAVAILIAAPLLWAKWLDGSRTAASAAAAQPSIPLRQLLTPQVLGLVGFFPLLSLSSGALTNYSAVALTQVHGIELNAANVALSGYLFLNATRVLAGGYIADMTKRHGDVAALGYGGAGVLILLVGLTPLHPSLLVGAMSAAGFLAGMISPSRDMLVRAASPPGAFGRIFGIVTTGFNIGGTIGPLLGGWIMDHGMPRWIFFSSVLFMAATSLMGLMSERNTRRRLAAAPAGE